MSILVQLASILLLSIGCCRTLWADSGPSTHAIESRGATTIEAQTAERASEQTRQSTRLTWAYTGHDEQHTIKAAEPSRLQEAKAWTTDIWAKWADLQSRI